MPDIVWVEPFRAKLKDYFRSGYDRGHQVPAADAKWSQEAMDDTFALSNMCPQVGNGFNRDYWAHFEDFCRRLTQRYPSVRIVTGPLYLPRKDPTDNKWYVKYEMIGNPPSVAVPTPPRALQAPALAFDVHRAVSVQISAPQRALMPRDGRRFRPCFPGRTSGYALVTRARSGHTRLILDRRGDPS